MSNQEYFLNLEVQILTVKYRLSDTPDWFSTNKEKTILEDIANELTASFRIASAGDYSITFEQPLINHCKFHQGINILPEISFNLSGNIVTPIE